MPSGPQKRVYKKYEDDHTVPVPKRTTARHSARKRLSAVQSSSLAQSTSYETQSAEKLRSSSLPPHKPETEASVVVARSIHSHENATACVSDDHSDSMTENDQFDLDNVLTEQDPALVDHESDTTGSEFDIHDGNLSDHESDTYSFVESDSSLSELSEDDDTSDGSISDVTSADSSEETESVSQYAENEVQAMCLLSHILRYNVSRSAAKDMFQLLPVLCPGYENVKKITFTKLMSLAGVMNCKMIHYCSLCQCKFPEDLDIFVCSTHGCNGYRYKGTLSCQDKKGRQPRSFFVLADVEKQLQYILQRKGVWGSVQTTKQYVKQNHSPEHLGDIVDGLYYRSLCQPGHFLHENDNISVLFNTDGVPLYSSSNVKLWPIFLAINELPPAARFARENMVLAAIWQGKDKPPFSLYMSAFGELMCGLHDEGFCINLSSVDRKPVVKVAVIAAVMDLQAKAYVLNMTMHNGHFGCSTCEEPGESVQQGKGYARFYPYRDAHEKPNLRNTDDIKFVKGPNATPGKRLTGICGISGLSVMPWFDLVVGVVPDYMHGALLGVTKVLMYKFFSSTNAGKEYFVGRHLKQISSRLQSICPPDYIERMPRDLERHYSNFKATELQSWLLFYAVPCLHGFLSDVYLEHLACLCEGIHLLLGDKITECQLGRAEALLDSFYKGFADLYGKGSCGLNVHNIGAHLVFYVRMFGPLWAWSCFAFEDWNAALLQSVHGTGDVTMQCLQLKEMELRLNSLDLNSVPGGAGHSYLAKTRYHKKDWSTTKEMWGVNVAGRLEKLGGDINPDTLQMVLSRTNSAGVNSLRRALRVKILGQKFYSFEYKRMKKRICYVVRCKNGDLCEIQYFLVNTVTNMVFAYATKLIVSDACFICDDGPHHICRVIQNNDVTIFPAVDIVEKVFLMCIDGLMYVAFTPNMGHGIFK